MYRGVVALGLVLVMATGAFAQVPVKGEVQLTLTDMGTLNPVDLEFPLDVDSGCRAGFTDIPAVDGVYNVLPGDKLLVHVWLTPTETSTGIQSVQLRPWGPATTLPLEAFGNDFTTIEDGMADIDTINQPPDSIPNFWFDYSASGTLMTGTFPARGLYTSGIGPAASPGPYSDFSNIYRLDAQQNIIPMSPQYAAAGGLLNALAITQGAQFRVGAMAITAPEFVPGGNNEYTIDFLNGENLTDLNTSFTMQIEAGGSFNLWTAAYESTQDTVHGHIAYASTRGMPGGPLTIRVPEPASLALLALGGLAVLRRRRVA